MKRSLWKLVYIIAFLLGFLTHRVACSAEGAPVEFTDAQDLIAKQDSVIGVVDTVGYEMVSAFESIDWYNPYIDSGRVEWVEKPTIRHRRFAGVTKTREIEKVRNPKYDAVFLWDKPILFEVDPPDLKREAEYDSLYTEWEKKLSKIPMLLTIPGTAVIWYESEAK